jgi:hypothetical protein
MKESPQHSYDNPRRLPKAWIESYLQRDRSLLALDVMRAFDANWKVEQKLGKANIKIWVLMLLLTGEGALILFLLKLVFHQ